MNALCRIWLCMLIVGMILCATNEINAQRTNYLPKIIKKVSVPPVVDGKLDDASWLDCEKWPLYENVDRSKRIVGGTVSVCYDDNNIYAAFCLEEPSVDKINDTGLPVNDTKLWNGEVVEWFINVNPEGRDFFQFAWNSVGAKFSQRDIKGRRELIITKWLTASSKGDKKWITEAAISFAALNATLPTDGTAWSMNLARTRNVDGKAFSSIVPGIGSFGNSEAFPEIWFNKCTKEQNASIDQAGPAKALIASRGVEDGYGAFFEPCLQLDRALGKRNVEIREFNTAMSSISGWPRKLKDLMPYQCIVIADVPAAAFSSGQLQNLCDYVDAGGHLIMLGALTGYRHDSKNTWYNSALGTVIPIKTEVNHDIYRLSGDNIEKIIFENIPLEQGRNLVKSGKTTLINGGKCLAWVTINKNGKIERTPFIAEKQFGKGSIICIAGIYCSSSTVVPMDGLHDHFFTSKYYPLFWDNLIKYLTGRTVNNPAMIPAYESKDCARIKINIINDNYGDLFGPSSTITVKPQIESAVSYPCALESVITDSNNMLVSKYSVSLASKSGEITVRLPNLDYGDYTLALECKQAGKAVSGKAKFSVRLPLIEKDEFDFSVLIDGACIGEENTVRIAKHLKSIGFNGVFWLGGTATIKRGYDNFYRPYGESLFLSRMEAVGIRGQPALYTVLYEILAASSHPEFIKPGQIDGGIRLPMPDGAFPGKDLLPWNHSWINLFQEKAHGRLPLTKGFGVGDEIAGTALPISDKIKKGYEALTGKKTPENFNSPEAYDFFKYYLNIVPNTIWFSRTIFEKYNRTWNFESITTPNSLLGHTTSIIDPFAQCGVLGSTSPDIYQYGEKKLYQKTFHQLAMTYAATDFGKNSKFGMTGGHLSKDYYWTFPEQVFASIAAGAKYFNVYMYNTTNFEKNCREDDNFSEIAKKTTNDASIIGRTLNHYKREQARVALLYPFAAHVHMSMGQEKNNDYLQMIGNSPQYLDLIYAAEAEFELFRRMAGHVDYIYDQQIQRGDLKKYDVLVVGYCRQIEERTMREIVRYVKEGGTLFISTDSGKFNEHNQPSKTLYDVLPAIPGKEVKVSVDYSDTRLSKPDEWNTGNNLIVKKNAEILFSFPDKQSACAIGKVGRGEALVLGMPFAALLSSVNESKNILVEYILNRNSHLISKSHNRDFSAITFVPDRGDGKILMIFNGLKTPALTKITVCADREDASSTLVDIVNGERIPFSVKDDIMSFKIAVPSAWGRALALLKTMPAKPEVSVSGNPASGEKFCYAVRILGKDEQPVPYTLPVKVTITSPDGKVRDDLSGIRVTDRGVYAFAFTWPSNAMKGAWKITVSETISGISDSASWIVK